MLKSEDKLKIECNGTLSSDLFSSLHILYAPLLGSDVVHLYSCMLSLATQPQKVRNHLLLQKLSGTSMELLEKNRCLLEQYLLIKTYYNGAKNGYLYSVYMPKSGNDFLHHDVMGRLYMKKMGKQVYEYARKNFANNHEEKSEYQDITSSMQNLLGDWDEQAESAFSSLRPTQKNDLVSYAFNFDVFLQGLSTMILPQSERNADTLDFIANKASIYGIHEKEMQIMVGKSMNIKSNTLDRNKLTKLMQNAKKDYDKNFENSYLMPPVRFLQAKQHGVGVSLSDQRLIDQVLIEKYHLKNDVVNVLIEYVLERCNQMLSKAYVEKVASTWVRQGIDTSQKALDAIKNENGEVKFYKKSTEKKLPGWFHDQDSVQTSDEEINDEELMEELRKLGED